MADLSLWPTDDSQARKNVRIAVLCGAFVRPLVDMSLLFGTLAARRHDRDVNAAVNLKNMAVRANVR